MREEKYIVIPTSLFMDLWYAIGLTEGLSHNNREGEKVVEPIIKKIIDALRVAWANSKEVES